MLIKMQTLINIITYVMNAKDVLRDKNRKSQDGCCNDFNGDDAQVKYILARKTGSSHQTWKVTKPGQRSSQMQRRTAAMESET